MDFEENNKKSNFKKGIFLIVSLCVALAVAIGAVTVSRINKSKKNAENNQSGKNEEYSSSDNSYNSSSEITDIIPDQKPAETTANQASDVPYESQPQKTETKRKFVMPVTGEIIKTYSNEKLQYSATYGDMRLHEGIDIKCNEGTEVKSATNGTVKEVTEDANLGKTVIVDHGDSMIVKYCGFKDVAVKNGDSLEAGTVLGTSGTVPCECADPAHIHLQAQTSGNYTSILEAFGLK